MQNISRRAVLGSAVGTAALVAIGIDAAPAGAATTPAPLRSHYAPSVGKIFTAVRAGRSHQVTLTAIRDAVPTRAKDKPYAFTLILTPARGVRLPDGIYRLTRRGVRTHSLLLSSVGTAGKVQAAVNGTHR